MGQGWNSCVNVDWYGLMIVIYGYDHQPIYGYLSMVANLMMMSVDMG
jgi:hypothetical protein